MKKFKSKKNMNFLTVFLVLDVLLAFTMIRTSSASYSSTVLGTAELDVALYAFQYSGMQDTNDQVLEFDLGDIKPGQEKTYKFSVSNANSEGRVSDTSLRYNLKIISTNNLGLELELYKSGSRTVNLITSSNTSIVSDSYSTYFKYYTFDAVCVPYSDTETKDDYTLVVRFPERYKESKYQDMVESIKIQLTSKQLSSGESC